MNLRLFTMISVVGCAALAGWLIPIDEWAAVAKSMMTVLAIFAAAILVRLNRGMPTIDWSKVNAKDRAKLVTDIQKLAREYGVTLVFVGGALVLFLILDRSGTTSPLGVAIAKKSHSLPVAISAVAGAVSSFVLVRIAYVVWRDIDIVDLQAGVIAQAANADLMEQSLGTADAIDKAGVINPHKKAGEDNSEE